MDARNIVVALGTVLGIAGFTSMYNGWYIPSPKVWLMVGLALVVGYYVTSMGQAKKKKLDRLVAFSLTLFGVMILGSMVYSGWKMEKLITAFTMMKITLVLMGIIGIYLNIMFIRAEISYKKKRGNQRIKEQPNKTYFEKLREKREQEKSNELVLVLGKSTDNEEE